MFHQLARRCCALRGRNDAQRHCIKDARLVLRATQVQCRCCSTLYNTLHRSLKQGGACLDSRTFCTREEERRVRACDTANDEAAPESKASQSTTIVIMEEMPQSAQATSDEPRNQTVSDPHSSTRREWVMSASRTSLHPCATPLHGSHDDDGRESEDDTCDWQPYDLYEDRADLSSPARDSGALRGAQRRHDAHETTRMAVVHDHGTTKSKRRRHVTVYDTYAHTTPHRIDDDASDDVVVTMPDTLRADLTAHASYLSPEEGVTGVTTTFAEDQKWTMRDGGDYHAQHTRYLRHPHDRRGDGEREETREWSDWSSPYCVPARQSVGAPQRNVSSSHGQVAFANDTMTAESMLVPAHTQPMSAAPALVAETGAAAVTAAAAAATSSRAPPAASQDSVSADLIELVTDAFEEHRVAEVNRRRRVLYEMTHPCPEHYTYDGKLVPPPPLSFGRVTEEARVLGNRVMRDSHYHLVRQTGARVKSSSSSSATGAMVNAAPHYRGRKREGNVFHDHHYYFEVNELYQEIVLVGKANAGKSSLLNALLGQSVARSSSTPNTTKHISFYQSVSPQELHAFHAKEHHNQLVKLPGGGLQLTFVDVPGFGIEGMSDAWRDAVVELTDAYFGVRRSVNTVLFCMDCERGLTKSDMKYFQWLENVQGVFFVVLTKCDSVPHSRICSVMRQVYSLITKQRRKFRRVFPFIIPTSAHSGVNVEMLRGVIAETSGLVPGDRLRELLKERQTRVMAEALAKEEERVAQARAMETAQARDFFLATRADGEGDSDDDGGAANAADKNDEYEYDEYDNEQSEMTESLMRETREPSAREEDAEAAALFGEPDEVHAGRRRLTRSRTPTRRMSSHGGEVHRTGTTTMSTKPNTRAVRSAIHAAPVAVDGSSRVAVTQPSLSGHRSGRDGSTCGTGTETDRRNGPTALPVDHGQKHGRRTDTGGRYDEEEVSHTSHGIAPYRLHTGIDDKPRGSTVGKDNQDGIDAVHVRSQNYEKSDTHAHSDDLANHGDAKSECGRGVRASCVGETGSGSHAEGPVSQFLSRLESFGAQPRRSCTGRRRADGRECDWSTRRHLTPRLMAEDESGRLVACYAGRPCGPSLLRSSSAVETRQAEWKAHQLKQLLQRENATAPWSALPSLSRKLGEEEQRAAMRGMRKKELSAYLRDAGRVVHSFEKFEGEVTAAKYMNESRQAPTLRSQQQMHLNATAKISYRSMPPGLLKRYGEMDTYWPTPRVLGRGNDESHR